MRLQSYPNTFISGTFEDIKEFRKHVAEVLVSTQIMPIDLSGLRRRSMDVKELIDNHLDNANYYICVIGHRYGSRIGDEATNPSWTHYEYERFLARDQFNETGKAALDMLILIPKAMSEADKLCKENASEIMKRMGVPEAEQKRDAGSVAYFRKLVGGGAIGRPDPSLINPKQIYVETPLARANRSHAPPFANKDQIEVSIVRFLDEVRVVQNQRSGRGARLEERAPQYNPALRIPLPLLNRLAPLARSHALCVVVSRLDDQGLSAEQIADALAFENLADDEDVRSLDARNIEKANVDTLLEQLADQEFATEGATRQELLENIATETAVDPIPRMFRIDHVPTTGMAKRLLRDVWPELEKALKAKCEPAGRAGFFLIVSLDIKSTAIEALCQLAHNKIESPSKPILLTQQALFPDATAPKESQRQGKRLE